MVLQAGAGTQGEEEGSADTKCNGLTAAPSSHPPVPGVEIWLIFPQDESVLSVTATDDLQNKLSPCLCLNP